MPGADQALGPIGRRFDDAQISLSKSSSALTNELFVKWTIRSMQCEESGYRKRCIAIASSDVSNLWTFKNRR
jgi:hypothetical protein